MGTNLKYYRHLLGYQMSGESRVFAEWHFSSNNGEEVVNSLNQHEFKLADSEANRPLVGTPEGYKTTWWKLLLTHEITEEDYSAGRVNTIPLNQYIYYVNPA